MSSKKFLYDIPFFLDHMHTNCIGNYSILFGYFNVLCSQKCQGESPGRSG